MPTFVRWFWRVVGLLALILSALCLFFMIAVWRSISLQPVAAGKPVSGSLDVISLQIDILSLILAALGAGLGIAGLFGYQAIKDAALERATERAIAKADEVATDAVALHMENIERTRDALDSGNGPPSEEPDEVRPVTEGGADGGDC